MQTEEFQRRVLDFQDAARTDLATLKTQMTTLVGEAKPGRIDKLEAEVKDLRNPHDRGMGWRKVVRHGVTAAISAAVAWLTAHGKGSF